MRNRFGRNVKEIPSNKRREISVRELDETARDSFRHKNFCLKERAVSVWYSKMI